MTQLQKIIEKTQEKGITDQERASVYEYARKVGKPTIEEVCPALHRLCLNSEKGPLKSELGRVIFHLQKNERLDTLIGLQKLLEASLIVNPEGMFEILESSDEDAKELAENIKNTL